MAKGWLIGGGAFLVILLVVSIIVALLEREEPLTAGTPEAAVQQFLKAAESEDLPIAFDSLSAALKVECSLEEFGGRSYPTRNQLGDSRVTLEKSQVIDDIAFVTVRISQFRGSGPFGTSESTFEQRYSLLREEGDWKFAEYPWPFFSCGPFKPVAPRAPEVAPPETPMERAPATTP
ncbi:MAG: hypothetical protein IH861_07415 [Chloroflexi bacterium]|nr:hypothetical protein [Chloroflexota bacterium]